MDRRTALRSSDQASCAQSWQTHTTGRRGGRDRNLDAREGGCMDFKEELHAQRHRASQAVRAFICKNHDLIQRATSD
jgi:hypothetical protein